MAVSVKQKLADGSIKLFSAAETRRAISAGAKQAVSNLDTFAPLQVKFPLHVRLRLKDKPTTDGYIKWRRDNKPDWPGRRTGVNTLEATLVSTKHIVF